MSDGGSSASLPTATVEVVTLNRPAILRDDAGQMLTDDRGELLFDDAPDQP